MPLMVAASANNAKGTLDQSTLTAVVALAAAVFVIDAFLPLGVAGGVPYVAVILLALRSSSARFVVITAIVCGVLTLLDMLLSPGPGNTEWWKVVVNRGLSLFAIGVTASLGLQRNRSAAVQQRQLTELAHLSRVKTAECLAGSLAHELNQPLTAVSLQAEIARQLLLTEGVTSANSRQDSLSAALLEITEQSQRASSIVRSLRDLVRQSSSACQPTDLNGLIQDAVRLVQPIATQTGIEIRLQLAARLPLVDVDRVQIQQVLLNLLNNAVDALSLSTIDEPLISVASRSTSPREVVIEVSDSGPGISAEQRQRLFEPFSSTKPHGLGLGLNLCRSIVEAHGGRLWLVDGPVDDTVPSRGTRFAFTLPVVDEPSNKRPH